MGEKTVSEGVVKKKQSFQQKGNGLPKEAEQRGWVFSGTERSLGEVGKNAAGPGRRGGSI